ncbi:hypothetical protein [Trichormus azollae]|uniref:hypothetical protein n=1 Tax=Trichormus azollae TaxID=1164 RepID=UPI00325C9255
MKTPTMNQVIAKPTTSPKNNCVKQCKNIPIIEPTGKTTAQIAEFRNIQDHPQ